MAHISTCHLDFVDYIYTAPIQILSFMLTLKVGINVILNCRSCSSGRSAVPVPAKPHVAKLEINTRTTKTWWRQWHPSGLTLPTQGTLDTFYTSVCNWYIKEQHNDYFHSYFMKLSQKHHEAILYLFWMGQLMKCGCGGGGRELPKYHEIRTTKLGFLRI